MIRRQAKPICLSLLLIAAYSSAAWADRHISVAIIGGGLSGLSTQRTLERQGIKTEIFEAASRLGGRIQTQYEFAGKKVTLELGAELVDSKHTLLIQLAHDLQVPLLDRRTNGRFPDKVFFFDGEFQSEDEFNSQIFAKSLASLQEIQLDLDTLAQEQESKQFEIEEPLGPLGQALDRISIAQYLSSKKLKGSLLEKYFQAAVSSESGVALDSLSALVLLNDLKIDLGKKTVELFAYNDEAYEIAGGSQRLIDELLRQSPGLRTLQHRLKRVQSKDGLNFNLVFDTPDGEDKVSADSVVYTAPLSALHEIQLDITGLNPETLDALKEVSYAHSLKLAWVFKSPVWSKPGKPPEQYLFQDGLQIWPSHPGEPQEAAILMAFMAQGSADSEKAFAEITRKILGLLEQKIPGLNHEYLGLVPSAWDDSYAWAFAPGEASRLRLRGLEPTGRFFWAGEAFGTENRSYMEGALESADQAARGVAFRLKSASSFHSTIRF